MTRFEMRFPVQIRPLVAPFLHRLITHIALPHRLPYEMKRYISRLSIIVSRSKHQESAMISRHSRPSVPAARCLGR
jgi:hypothetical protein